MENIAENGITEDDQSKLCINLKRFCQKLFPCPKNKTEILKDPPGPVQGLRKLPKDPLRPTKTEKF